MTCAGTSTSFDHDDVVGRAAGDGRVGKGGTVAQVTVQLGRDAGEEGRYPVAVRDEVEPVKVHGIHPHSARQRNRRSSGSGIPVKIPSGHCKGSGPSSKGQKQACAPDGTGAGWVQLPGHPVFVLGQLPVHRVLQGSPDGNVHLPTERSTSMPCILRPCCGRWCRR